MANTGREVASGQLWMAKGENVKMCVRVTAHCGTPDLRYQGQLNIYEESLNQGNRPGTTGPSRIIAFATVTDVTALNSAVPVPFAPLPSNRSSFSRSMDLTSQRRTRHLWGFMLLLQTGEALELFSESQEQQKLWVKHLSLLAMFPNSPIPEEPRVNPIRDGFRTRVNQANFNADSVWPVYILSEEVGSRIQALGVHIVTLQSALNSRFPAQMRIISPLDNTPIVTWDADKMRRNGNLGNMAFIEIGRRCEGGPGLVWMYTSPEDAPSFRETLGNFLFRGDGRRDTTYGPGPNLPEPTYMYDRAAGITPTNRLSSPSSSLSPSSSFSTSPTAPLPTPCVRRGSAVYDYAEISPTNSAGCDSPLAATTKREFPFSKAYGHVPVSSSPPCGALKPSSLPLTTNPPPVNLTTHPSRKKSHKRSHSGSEAPMTQQQRAKQLLGRTELSSGVLNRQASGSNDSGFPAESLTSFEGEFSAIDETLSNLISELSSQSESSSDKHEKPEVLDEVIAQLEGLAADDDDVPAPKPSPEPLHRSNSLPSGISQLRKTKRANSTSTCHPTHYLKMTNPRMAMVEDGYVIMQPKAHQDADCTVLSKEEKVMSITKEVMSGLLAIQEEPSDAAKDCGLTFNLLDPTLSDFMEDIAPSGRRALSHSPPRDSSPNYENHPLPADVANAKEIIFQRSYENICRETGSPPVLPLQTTRESSDRDLYMNQTGAQLPKQDRHLSTTWNEIQFLENVLEQFVSEN